MTLPSLQNYIKTAIAKRIISFVKDEIANLNITDYSTFYEISSNYKMTSTSLGTSTIDITITDNNTNNKYKFKFVYEIIPDKKHTKNTPIYVTYFNNRTTLI